jgi:hypothetical protein
LSRLVQISTGFDPGNGISSRLIEAAVLPIDLAMGLTAAIDQAVAEQRLLSGASLHRHP